MKKLFAVLVLVACGGCQAVPSLADLDGDWVMTTSGRVPICFTIRDGVIISVRSGSGSDACVGQWNLVGNNSASVIGTSVSMTVSRILELPPLPPARTLMTITGVLEGDTIVGELYNDLIFPDGSVEIGRLETFTMRRL